MLKLLVEISVFGKGFLSLIIGEMELASPADSSKSFLSVLPVSFPILEMSMFCFKIAVFSPSLGLSLISGLMKNVQSPYG